MLAAFVRVNFLAPFGLIAALGAGSGCTGLSQVAANAGQPVSTVGQAAVVAPAAARAVDFSQRL